MNGKLYYTDQKISFDVAKNQTDKGDSVQNWDYVPPSLPLKRGISFVKMRGIDDAPQELRQLNQMFEDEPWSVLRKKSFYEQALVMVDFEDDADIVPFSEYFPVYRSMNTAQLRSYFTFRKLIRRGEYPDVGLSYIFVYIYEILMQIGIENPNIGLDILKNLKDAYSFSQPKVIRYLDLWMQDYVVYYRLTNRVGEFFIQEKQEDDLAALLSDYKDINETLLFDTASLIASYKIKNGALFKKYPDDVTSVAARTIKAAIPIYEQRTTHHIEELCLGLKKQTPHPIFASAVFYRPDAPKENSFQISPRRKYYCKGGLWSKDTFRDKIFQKKGEPFGLILQETDRRLRISMHLKFSMAKKIADPIVENAIQKAIDQYLLEKAEEARPKINVDFTKLDKIRSDADIIRDALLSEEEIEKDLLPTDNQLKDTPEIAEEPPTPCRNNSIFSDQEVSFLQLLVKSGDWKNYLRNIRLPIGVITDSINEKTMVDIQDIVIVDEGDGPTLLSDYIDYIIKMI